MFNPQYTINPNVANALMRIEAAKEAVSNLPLTPKILNSLRRTARLHSTHYSTMIEGNRLTQEEVGQVIEESEHFPERERDEKEVLGYYAALEKLEALVSKQTPVSQKNIQLLHALVMNGGKKKVNPTPYRDGQNIIKDSTTGKIVYMPPEAKDVSELMTDLEHWLHSKELKALPCPIQAGIAHYQFATIHPYYDGNGRTARLLTTLILHLGGYDLKGLYSLEEYYARDLNAYYEALTIGDSHNYYMGRAEADITKWIEYFCTGMTSSFETVRNRASEAALSGAKDASHLLRKLDPRQRKALELFQRNEYITSQDIASLFNLKPRTARDIAQQWIQSGFLEVVDPAKRSRKYSLAPKFQTILNL